MPNEIHNRKNELKMYVCVRCSLSSFSGRFDSGNLMNLKFIHETNRRDKTENEADLFLTNESKKSFILPEDRGRASFT